MQLVGYDTGGIKFKSAVKTTRVKMEKSKLSNHLFQKKLSGRAAEIEKFVIVETNTKVDF